MSERAALLESHGSPALCHSHRHFFFLSISRGVTLERVLSEEPCLSCTHLFLCLFSLNFICQLWRLTFKESSIKHEEKTQHFHLLACFFCKLVSQLLCCRQFPIKVLKVHSFGNFWLVVLRTCSDSLERVKVVYHAGT